MSKSHVLLKCETKIMVRRNPFEIFKIRAGKRCESLASLSTYDRLFRSDLSFFYNHLNRVSCETTKRFTYPHLLPTN